MSGHMVKPGDRILIGGEEHTVTRVTEQVVPYRVPLRVRLGWFLFELRWHLWDAWCWVRWTLRGRP